MSPFGVYVRLFAEALGEDYGKFAKRFNAHHIKVFETRTSNWVIGNEGWTRKHLIALFFFCHYHNPLLVTSLQEYGNLDNVGRCVVLFNKWLKAYAKRIEQEGLLKVVIDTTPNIDDESKGKALSYDEVRALYG